MRLTLYASTPFILSFVLVASKSIIGPPYSSMRRLIKNIFFILYEPSNRPIWKTNHSF